MRAWEKRQAALDALEALSLDLKLHNVSLYWNWHEWRRAHIGVRRDCPALTVLIVGTAPGPGVQGMACPECHSIFVRLWICRNAAEIRELVLHELLHLRRPDWNEERVAEETRRLTHDQ
jgi:hypothetical protein